ncbi:MAG: hypothetical protein HOQ22_03185, partial [Nocardioidaceae bacterium]|nr:hypothetical protein [Nocardioidaceae bacterium]
GDGPTDADRARGVTTGFAERVGSALLAAVGYEGEATFADPATGPDVDGAPAVLVLANGSARRGDEAPGYVDERAFGVDEVLVKALADGDTAPLAAADPVLGAELMAAGTSALNAVAAAAHDVRASLLYEGDPLGVQYWVATWECG